MKKIRITALIGMCCWTAPQVYAQNVIYSGFVNVASEGFNFPLIGLVNIAKGNHRPMQIGLFNWTQGNFDGFQTGLANITMSSVSGLQLGLANITAGDVTGVEMGVNITKKITGLQIGLLNLVDDAEDGFPIGLLSIVRNGGYHAIEAGVSGNAAAHVAIKLGVEKLLHRCLSFTIRLRITSPVSAAV